MHDDHNHSHGHTHAHGDMHHHGDGRWHSHAEPSRNVGHNGPAGKPVQWQTPHLPHDHQPPAETATTDIDLVETAFIEGFGGATDPTSFLRLAGIPFVGKAQDCSSLHLLRVEVKDSTDIGSVMPLVGGAGFTYNPLPKVLASRRRKLDFVYQRGAEQVRLDFASARGLADLSGPSRVETGG